MKDFQIILAATSSVILFVFGLENFSKEVQNITGEKFRKFLGSATMYPVVGVLIGAIITALIQSSSATSVIAISLVNAGVMSFKNSVGIIFGANVGTTVTAQLVAFKLTAFAPIFIILGFLLSFTRSRYAIFGKTFFYFGFVFFSLNLISSALAPLQSDSRLIEFLTQAHNPLLGVLVGAVITAIVQSSSVTTGLAIIFTQQGLMSLDNAIPILMGSNLGTTVTALISIINMDISAKKTALAHFLFNLGGVLIFLPIIIFWGDRLPLMSNIPAIALANFHLIFNVTTSLIFIVFLNPFSSLIDRMLGEGQMDFERIELGLKEETQFDEIEKNLMVDLEKTFRFVQENYNLVTLSIETNYRGIYEAAKKRIEYMDFLKAELLGFFSKFISKCNNEDEIDRIVNVMAMYEYIFQMHDSVKDIAGVKESMDNNYIELKSDVLMIVREIASTTLSVFENITSEDQKDKDLKKISQEFQRDLEGFGKKVFILMAKPERNDAGAIMHLLTYSQRLKDKLMNFHHLKEGHIAP
ncbi:Na/Pi cotransporter family protein [Halobacteriovorax sp. RT-2-6]|uniref:Na/Pi cotransporter family protein n=1 Tax=unclassified Halobacteriovorax TaxID=2639665 RepID=UPI003999AC8C